MATATTTRTRPSAKSARTTSKAQGPLQFRVSAGQIVMYGGFDLSWEMTAQQAQQYGQALINAAARAQGQGAKTTR